MKILVTGANGYLGRGIVYELLNKGHEVIATDFSTDNVDIRAKKKNCDLFRIDNPMAYFEQPEILLHLAWKNGFLHDSKSHLEELHKHYQFINQLIEEGLKKIVVMGSMHEVGFYEGAISENTPCHPMNLYGIAKNALRDSIELLAKSREIKFQWLRGFYIVENTTYGSSIFSKIANCEEKGDLEFPFTSGQNQYDFLDYEIFCNYVSTCVEQDEILGIINISSGKPEKLAERVERFIKENGFNIRLKYGAYPDRKYDSKAVWGDNKKITKIIANKNK